MIDRTSLERRSLIAALCAPMTLGVMPKGVAATDEIPKEIRAVLQSYADAWQRGDAAALMNLYHDDFTLHYPGRHALAGMHAGKAEALRVLRTVGERTNRKLASIIDVMAGSYRGCLNVTEQWTRNDETVFIERVFVYTVQGGKLVQCWLFDADQEIVAKFLAA